MSEARPYRDGVLIALLVLPLACGDSGPAGDDGGGGGGDLLRPTSDVQLSGDQSFRRVEIPAGVTVRASEDLRLEATREMRVEGSIVGDCVALELIGGSVELIGTVRNDCSGALPASPPGLTIRSSGPLAVVRSVVRSSGETAVVGALEGAGALTPAQEPACVLDGSRLEAAPSEAAPAFDGASWSVSCGGSLRIAGTTVRSQDGGGGEADTSGEPVAVGTDGGAGGDVRIAGTTIEFTGINVLQAGNGRPGGDAEAVATDPGGDAEATAGDGGPAGAIEISSSGSIQVDGPLTLQLGAGGAGGTARAEAASGADGSADAPAQQGGDAVAVAGDGGEVPGVELDEPRVSGAENVFIRAGDAGEGGIAAALAGDGGTGSREFPSGAVGGTAEAVGGDGGSSDVTGLGGSPLSRAGGGGGILLTGANGGRGADLCASVADPDAAEGPGGPGGPGGRASGRDGRPGEAGTGEAGPGGAVLFQLGNGGDGGAGSPPGPGGPAGVDATEVAGSKEEQFAVFEPGDPGGPCPPLLDLNVRATIQLQSGGDPAGLDPEIFDIPAGGQNPNQQPTGSVQHPLRILASQERIRVEGPAPWIDVEGELQADGTFRAEGTGTIGGSPGTAVLEGLFIQGGLSTTLTMTVEGGASVRYSVISPQILQFESPGSDVSTPPRGGASVVGFASSVLTGSVDAMKIRVR